MALYLFFLVSNKTRSNQRKKYFFLDFLFKQFLFSLFATVFGWTWLLRGQPRKGPAHPPHCHRPPLTHSRTDRPTMNKKLLLSRAAPAAWKRSFASESRVFLLWPDSSEDWRAMPRPSRERTQMPPRITLLFWLLHLLFFSSQTLPSPLFALSFASANNTVSISSPLYLPLYFGRLARYYYIVASVQLCKCIVLTFVSNVTTLKNVQGFFHIRELKKINHL